MGQHQILYVGNAIRVIARFKRRRLPGWQASA